MKNYLKNGLITVIGVLAAITGYDQFQKTSRLVAPLEAIPVFSDPRVRITARAYNAEDSKLYLSHDLISRGVQPLQISIENNSSREYSLCASSIDLPHIDPADAAYKVTKSAIPRTIAYRIASLFFWPIAFPGTIDGLRTYSKHLALKTDYRTKGFKEKGEVVAPYSTYHRILFVPQEGVINSFAVTLIDLETLEQTVYPIQIEQIDASALRGSEKQT